MVRQNSHQNESISTLLLNLIGHRQSPIILMLFSREKGYGHNFILIGLFTSTIYPYRARPYVKLPVCRKKRNVNTVRSSFVCASGTHVKTAKDIIEILLPPGTASNTLFSRNRSIPKFRLNCS